MQVLPIGETRDLFNQVRVTLADVELWVLTVAGIPTSSWRFTYYARGWNVAEKVKAAKISGSWPPTLPNCQ